MTGLPSPEDDARPEDEADDDAPASTPRSGGDARPPQNPRRRQLGILIVIGALIATAPLLDNARNQRRLVLRLSRPEGLVAVQATVMHEGEVLWAVQRHFAAGAAPATLERELPMNAGPYLVLAELRTSKGTQQVRRQVTVEDDSDEVTVPLP